MPPSRRDASPANVAALPTDLRKLRRVNIRPSFHRFLMLDHYYVEEPIVSQDCWLIETDQARADESARDLSPQPIDSRIREQSQQEPPRFSSSPTLPRTQAHLKPPSQLPSKHSR